MGTANDYDDHIRARGANASIVGEPFGTNETKITKLCEVFNFISYLIF